MFHFILVWVEKDLGKLIEFSELQLRWGSVLRCANSGPDSNLTCLYFLETENHFFPPPCLGMKQLRAHLVRSSVGSIFLTESNIPGFEGIFEFTRLTTPLLLE